MSIEEYNLMGLIVKNTYEYFLAHVYIRLSELLRISLSLFNRVILFV